MFSALASPTFPVAIPQPFCPAVLRPMAYLSGCVFPVFGASQFKTAAEPLSVTVRFLGAPIVLTTGAACEVNADDGMIPIDPD